MSFKTVLTHVRPTHACGEALRAAVAFAQLHDADLLGVGGRAPTCLTDPWSGYAGQAALESAAERDAAELREAETRFRDAARALGGRAHWAVRN